MGDTALAAIDVANLVKEHFGARVSNLRLRKDGGLDFALYDAFAFGAFPDDYGSGNNWGFGLVLADRITCSKLLGQRLTILESPQQIREALAAIDRYARLRLSADYLTVYEAALSKRT